jgi:hypothetical protein
VVVASVVETAVGVAVAAVDEVEGDSVVGFVV